MRRYCDRPERGPEGANAWGEPLMLPGTLDAEGLFWALLFSLPTGVGVALAAGRSVNAPPTIPLALAMGGVTFAVTFVLVAAAAATNQEEEPVSEPADESAPPEP